MLCWAEKILFFILNLMLISHVVLSKMVNSDIAEILHRPIRSLTFPENSNMGIFVAIAVPLENPLNSISLSYFFEANYVLPPNITYFEPWTELKRKKRTIDRATIYRVLESKFESVLDYRANHMLIVQYENSIEENSFEMLQHRDTRNRNRRRFEIERHKCTLDSTLRAFGVSGNCVTYLTRSGNPGRECLLRAICETSEYPLRHNGIIGDIMHVVFTPSASRHEELPQDVVEAELVGRNGNCSKYQPQCPQGLFDLIGVLA